MDTDFAPLAKLVIDPLLGNHVFSLMALEKTTAWNNITAVKGTLFPFDISSPLYSYKQISYFFCG
jgi:hypothetical protein